MDVNKQQKHDEGFDGLPDEVVQEIISNLPIREAIETSLISQRWKDLWKGISNIELEEGDGRREKFTNFVEKILAVYNPLLLRKFSLICEVVGDTPQVNRWLSGFIKPNIEELTLDFERVEEPLVFPDELFRSEKLTHFDLSMPHVINLPSFINFVTLRTLTLKHVIFPNTCSTQQLFTACPSLKELTLIDCIWMHVGAVCIACPSLQKLVIREWKDDDDDDDEENIDAVGQTQNNIIQPYCQIVIVGNNNLKKFSYDGDILNDYSLYSTTSITDGTVEVQPPKANTLHAGHFVLKLLTALSRVEKLSISDFAAEALSHASSLVPYIPLFENLVELQVVSGAPMNFACDALQTILRRSPNLEAVDFVMGVCLDKNAVNKVNPLPPCLETKVKTIRIYGFKGSEEEMFAIKYLLQSTPVLDALCVYINACEFDSGAGSKRLDKLFKKIGRFPTASVDCGIYFE